MRRAKISVPHASTEECPHDVMRGKKVLQSKVSRGSCTQDRDLTKVG